MVEQCSRNEGGRVWSWMDGGGRDAPSYLPKHQLGELEALSMPIAARSHTLDYCAGQAFTCFLHNISFPQLGVPKDKIPLVSTLARSAMLVKHCPA